MLSKGAQATRFGAAIAFANFRLVVGAPGQNAPVTPFFSYTYASPTWQDEVPVPDTSGATGSSGELGAAVAVDGNLVVVGAPSLSPRGGAVIYQRVNNKWVVLSTVTDHPAPLVGDDVLEIGRAVAVSKNIVVIGAPATKQNSTPNGAAFVYRCQ